MPAESMPHGESQPLEEVGRDSGATDAGASPPPTAAQARERRLMDEVLLATTQELGSGQQPTLEADRTRLLRVARARPGQPLNHEVAGELVAAMAAARFSGLDAPQLQALSGAIAEVLLEAPTTCDGLANLWRWLQEATTNG